MCNKYRKIRRQLQAGDRQDNQGSGQDRGAGLSRSETARFNAIKRRLETITRMALTEALRRLERNGLVTRRGLMTSPLGVEYSITPLGRSLQA